MKLRIPKLLVVLAVMIAPAYAATTELQRQGLEQRIDFWKKVYTEYGKDDIVIHDSFYVNLIYGISDDKNVNAGIVAAKSSLKEIRANLIKPEALSPAAQQVYDSIAAQQLLITPELIDTLSESIHTQRGIKERFRDGIVRSGRYIERFEQIMERSGVPKELALLPLVESSFQNARSKAGAVGVWQFTRSTGKLYMKVGTKVDERLDPLKSTNAAARLLKGNYETLGHWPLAITAYNHGRAGMVRAKNAQGASITAIIDNYRGPLFGYASMNFYSEFLAAVDVYNSYPAYFPQLALDAPDRSESPKADTPQYKAAKVTSTARSVKTVDKYKVRSGDTLTEIAQRFGTSIRQLMEINSLEKTAIYAGQLLVVK